VGDVGAQTLAFLMDLGVQPNRIKDTEGTQGETSMIDDGDYFIRCGIGRKSRQLWRGGAPTDFVLAREWEKLREATLTTEHAKINARNLDGRTVGEAFLEYVIRDPKVQAAGKWLCLERPEFSPLFTEGKFPAVVHKSAPVRTTHRPGYASVGYPELKERSNPEQTTATLFVASSANSLRWDEKWPLFLDAKELSRVFVSRYLNANYQNDPSEGPIFHAAEALADRHGVFFDLLRARILVAGGTFTGTGQEMPIPEKQWSRKDRYLDVHHTDFFSQEGETVKALWESVTVHLPGPEAITRAADLPIVHPTSAPSPLPSAEKDASTLIPPGKRGRSPMVAWRVEQAMEGDIKEGRHTPESLAKMREKQMEATYGASRDSCRKARKKVLSEIHFRQLATNDK
jgi:hypothetical protein